MTRIISAVGLVLLLVACSGQYIPLPIITPVISPSPLPVILSPTPPFIPSSTYTVIILPFTPTSSETPSKTQTETPTSTATTTPFSSATSTATFTFTATNPPTPTTIPTQPSDLALDILGCNTSLDILHHMGEVTNAYPVVLNHTVNNLTNVCATLTASDEARVHPDKISCVAALPAGYQVILKLTVDTGFKQDTAIQVVVSTTEGLSASASHSSCRAIGLPDWLPDKVGVIEPIP
jgi:hypothetical protein